MKTDLELRLDELLFFERPFWVYAGYLCSFHFHSIWETIPCRLGRFGYTSRPFC